MSTDDTIRRFTFMAAISMALGLLPAQGVLRRPSLCNGAMPRQRRRLPHWLRRPVPMILRRCIAFSALTAQNLLSSGDRYADEERERHFAAAYDEKHTLVPKGAGQMTLDVGNDDWPLPMPIVQIDGRWQFDTQAGAQEIIDRRIGRNELAAIRVSLTYVDAQKDYFDRMKQQTGAGYYAERLVSTPGRQDGLYWPATGANAESPFGPSGGAGAG